VLSLTLDRETFAAKRRGVQTELEEALSAAVADAIEANDWGDLMDVAEDAFRAMYEEEAGRPYARSLTTWRRRLRATLAKGSYETVPSREQTALWLATYILTTSSVEAAADDDADVDLEWVTMHDKAVRETHADVDGQTRPPGQPFDVDGHDMLGPGDVTAPMELWMGCRCALRPTLRTDTFAWSDISAFAGGTVTETATETPARRPEGLGVPWYGPLTVEGTWTGDKRKFLEGSVSWVDTSEQFSPLTWQKFSDEGHKSNVTIAGIEEVWLYEGQVWGAGHSLLTVPEADEWVGLLAEFGRFGVSIDADMTTFSVDEEEQGVVYSLARGRSACTVAIPAFDKAWVALGELPEEVRKKGKRLGVPADEDQVPTDGQKPPEADVPEDEMLRPDAPTDEDGAPIEPEEREEDRRKVKKPVGLTPLEQIQMAAASLGEFRDVPSGERDRLADAGKALPDGSFPIANTGDLRNAIQAIGRAKDPAKAKAHIKRRAKDLGAENLVPADWAGDVTEFVDVAPGRTEDGPGWLTNPVDTDRIRDYWVDGVGGAKIGWGTPGDFNRCRTLVAEYVKPQHINGYCANRHFDALGFWPGPGRRGHAADTLPMAADTLHLSDRTPAPALSLVASAGKFAGGGYCAPSEWFQDPKFQPGDGRMVVIDRIKVEKSDGTTELAPVYACPPTMEKQGEFIHIYGHLASWRTCHLDGLLQRGECVAPPMSASGYAYFLDRGVVALDNGEMAPVGQITLGGGHAGEHLSMRAALAHYDDSGVAVADIAIGEDEFGPWYNGWVRPGTSDEQITALRASALSGDWREVPRGSGNLELIAALAVNRPGFGLRRVAVGQEDGRQVSLVASLTVPEEAVPSGEQVVGHDHNGIDHDVLAEKIVQQMADTERRRRRIAALAAEAEAL
jgi:hypothetical protein